MAKINPISSRYCVRFRRTTHKRPTSIDRQRRWHIRHISPPRPRSARLAFDCAHKHIVYYALTRVATHKHSPSIHLKIYIPVLKPTSLSAGKQDASSSYSRHIQQTHQNSPRQNRVQPPHIFIGPQQTRDSRRIMSMPRWCRNAGADNRCVYIPFMPICVSDAWAHNGNWRLLCDVRHCLRNLRLQWNLLP